MVSKPIRKIFDPLDVTKKLEDKVMGRGKSAPTASTPAEATNVMAMGEEEAKRRRMRAAASGGGGTILGDMGKLGG